MSGGTESSPPSGADEWDRYLDRAEERAGARGGPGSVYRYLRLTESEMRALSAEECGEAAVMLSALAFKLQQEKNRCSSRALWCEQKLRKDLAVAMSRVHAYSFDERRGVVLAGDPEAARLDRERVAAEGMAARLDFLPQRLDQFVRTYLALQETKRKHRERD
jgi:hypothetical protein